MSEKSIQVLSTEKRVFPPLAAVRSRAHIKSIEEYGRLYNRSVNEPEQFWAEMAEANLSWSKRWGKVLDYDFQKPYIKWFEGGS